MSNFTTGQIAKLVEIEKARVRKGGQGLHGEVQALLDRLTSGGVGVKPDMDLRMAQAKVLWDKGWGSELGFKGFQDYLRTIPEIPTFPSEGDEIFDRVILVDMRISSLTRQCELLGVNFNGSGGTFKPRDPEKSKMGVYWMRCQDGRRNRNKKPKDCRKDFASCEVGGSVFEGLAIFAQDPKVIDDHVMDLPESVHTGRPEGVAFLEVWGDGPWLRWGYDDDASPDFGSVSRQDC